MVKIKICGITNQADYDNAVQLNVDFTGFIFYERSKRYVVPAKVKKIINNGFTGKNIKVGVFVNEKTEKIKEIYSSTGLDIIQLHGEETPDYCIKLGLPYWKVIRIKEKSSIELLFQYNCDVFLLDTFVNGKYGGTGKPFDILIAKEAIMTGKKIIVAGGLSVNNIISFLKLSPYAVDINSSIERKVGEKDYVKMKQIIETIRNMRI